MIGGIREFPHDLVERVESGTGGDRELDCLIEAALDGRTIRENGNMILAMNSRPPHDEYVVGWIDPGKTSRNFSAGHSVPPVRLYTASLDAVVSLIEQRLPGWGHCYATGWDAEGNCGGFVSPERTVDLTKAIMGAAKTPARALLAACLRALTGASNDG